MNGVSCGSSLSGGGRLRQWSQENLQLLYSINEKRVGKEVTLDGLAFHPEGVGGGGSRTLSRFML